ncbi:MAG: type II secretion system protein M [Verrucomicrobiales bacterium]|nr:type II secretion system protein M [Verrucomicrobiales bacterium]
MNPHRQSIVIFSVAIPAILVVGMLLAVLVGRGKLHANHEEKVSNFKAYQTASTQVEELEALLSLDERREKIEYWNEKLDQDFIQSISGHLSTILARYDDNVLKQTEMKKTEGSTGIGSKSENPFSAIQLRFEGGFKPMQLLMAELEREMPQLVLDSISIKANPAQKDGDQGSLSFSIVYFCWEKPKA